MESTRNNIVANFVGRAWGFISIFIFLPIYLKLLGSEAYGIVSFSTVIIGFLSFMDAGLTATLMREFARVDRSAQDKQNMLRTVEAFYLGICLVIVIVLWGTAPLIAKYWLNVATLDINVVVHCLRVMGLCIAFQFLSNLYVGGIMGLGKQVMANVLNIGFGLFRYGGALVALLVIPSLEIYFYWQLVAVFALVMTVRITLKRELPNVEKAVYSKDLFKDIYRYALGMMALSILSAILIQSDKLIGSKMLSLSNFGYYALASQISQVPLVLSTSIIMAIYPRLIGCVSAGNNEELNRLYKQTSLAITLISTLATALLFWFMPTILYLWTHNSEMVAYTTPAARILCLGTWFQGLQVTPYYLGLSNGHTRTNMIMGIFSVLLIIPLLIILVQRMGVIGASIPWLIMSFATFFALSYIILKRFLPLSFSLWVSKEVAIPALGIWIVVSLVKGSGLWLDSSIVVSTISLGMAALLGLGMAYLIYSKRYSFSYLIYGK